jgi:hypothetical protein
MILMQDIPHSHGRMLPRQTIGAKTLPRQTHGSTSTHGRTLPRQEICSKTLPRQTLGRILVTP